MYYYINNVHISYVTDPQTFCYVLFTPSAAKAGIFFRSNSHPILISRPYRSSSRPKVLTFFFYYSKPSCNVFFVFHIPWSLISFIDAFFFLVDYDSNPSLKCYMEFSNGSHLSFLSEPLFDAKILAILNLKTVPQIEVNIKSSEKKTESISPEIW